MRYLIGGLLALFLCPAFGATWYVDCSAGVNGAGTSFTVPFNATSSLNWTTIDTGNDDVLFRSGVTCNNSQLGGASGFPNALGVAGASGDYVRIGVYDPASGAEILSPTSAQRARFVGDGTTRTEMISLFGFSFTVVNGIACSGGSNSSGRGCISAGVNGATPPSNLIISNNEVVQGSSPTNTATMYGIVVAGTSSGATGSAITITNNTVSGLVGTSVAAGVLCSNMDGCTITNNTIDASGFSAPAKYGIWTRSTIDARAVTSNMIITDNTVIGGQIGIRHNFDYTLGATMPYLNTSTVSRNTLTDQTSLGISLGFPRASLIEDNIITGAGLASGDGAGITFSSLSGYVGGSDTMGTRVARNRITDSGKFGIWLLGSSKAIVEENVIEGCGFPGSVYSRCIELTTRDSSIETNANTLTLSALTGTGVTATAGGGTPFVAGDLEKIITGPSHNPGVLRITGFTSSTVVTGTVLVPFLSTSIAASRWGWEVLACENTIRGNTVSGAVANFSNGGGTEGLGIGLDDQTCKTVVERNFVFGNSFYGIESNNGHGNTIRSNALYGNGWGDDGVAGRSLRKSQINIKNSGPEVYNNSINCAGNSYGIAAENSQTQNPLDGPLDEVANGSIATYRNNVTVNCSIAGIVGNANDLASNNSFFGNALNYVWMPKLIYSSAPTVGDLTAQTLDSASLATDPKFVGGTSPVNDGDFRTRDTSPLRRAGTFVAPVHDYANRLFSTPPTIGAWEAASGDQANRSTAADRTAAANRTTASDRSAR